MTARPSLEELQRWMRWMITEPRGIKEALATPCPPVPVFLERGSSSTNALEGWPYDSSMAERYKEPTRYVEVIQEVPPLSRHDRLGVYANAYFYRLLESLAVDYRAVQRVVGEESFHDLVAHYLMHHPSQSPNIGDVGEAFPEFIRTYPLSKSFPFLHELAMLERAIMECLYSSHLPPLDVSALQTQTEDEWADARFRIDPTVRLMIVLWPVDAVWKDREKLDRSDLPKRPEPSPRHLLLYRDDNWVRVSAIGLHDWMALQMLQSGLPLGAVCGALSKQWLQEEKPLPVMEWFSSWVNEGIVREILWGERKHS